MLGDLARSGRAFPFGRMGFQFQLLESTFLQQAFQVPATTADASAKASASAAAAPVSGAGKKKPQRASSAASHAARHAPGGVLVNRVSPVSALTGVLRPGDVVTAIDGHAIAFDGTTVFRDEERIAFGFLLTSKFLGDDTAIDIVRDGVAMTLHAPLEDVPDLVPRTLYERKPQYIVHCGLVFTPLSEPYLAAAYSREWEIRAPIRHVYEAQHGVQMLQGQQIVLLASILSNAVTVGYEPEEVAGLPLLSLNGAPITCMRDLALALAAATGPFLRFGLADAKLVVLPRERSFAESPAVLAQHAIAAPMSEDLVAAVATAAAGAQGASQAVAVAKPVTATSMEAAVASGSAATASALGGAAALGQQRRPTARERSRRKDSPAPPSASPSV